MHLLAAQPGGFVDEEGIIDLDQMPADIVIMAAADSSLAALASAVDAFSDASIDTLLDKGSESDDALSSGHPPSIRLANWMQLLKPAALDLYRDKTLDHAKLVVVSLLGGASYWPYGLEQLIQWQAEKPGRQLIVVPGDDAEDPQLTQACSVSPEVQQQVWAYFRQGGADNNLQLLNFLANTFFAYDVVWHRPQILPNCLIYLPGSSLKYGQATLADWQQRWQSQPSSDLPVCALVFYRSHLQSDNTAMFDDLIVTLQQQGLRPLPIALNSLKDDESIGLTNFLLEQADAGLIINTTGFASNRVSSPDLSSQPSQFKSPFQRKIPVLQLILSSSTEDDWQQQNQGLRARDLAMQVVLPEMDGRIITRAISFKTEARWCDRAQISVVRYQLQAERAQFVAQLSQRFLSLTVKPNSDKRLALILANYPTKDGRIGNGVGLDTPETTINLLQALAELGYPISDIPETGTELIQRLLGAITNNPNTLSFLPCWQSLSLQDYQQYFSQLPQANQVQVLERWGEPQQDPKYRQGRLMLSGLRLGETFIGIQPARGFNMDLAANYHDPDLVPPHSYLAFYFWLRHQYQVDAVVHIGKHGNLEWLPGKGAALSDQCWPDIALGPMPHFYPFIVNDPGEGAQAKRRAQAVIIDHLMPPMTRAETYGELAELEALVDEYYQAMGMDVRRSEWLRQRIIEQVTTTHILDELGLTSTPQQPLANNSAETSHAEATSSVTNSVETNSFGNTDAEDDALLNRLDAYLCDIKEAQIRNGLHILGRLPDSDKLVDTLVALLRLPRGSQAAEQGILNNLSLDLGLVHQQKLFDPLQVAIEPWQSSQPCLPLYYPDPQPQCRTTAQVRDWLENVAQFLVQQCVVNPAFRPERQKESSSESSSEISNKLRSELRSEISSEQDNALAKGETESLRGEASTAVPIDDPIDELKNAMISDVSDQLPATSQQLGYASSVVLTALETSVKQEISALTDGLAGRFVEPGPSGAPTRGRLDTLPTGRNFFAVDNRSIPSQAAWAIGQRSADALIERHLQEHGDYPKQLGLSVWGTATMRTGGDDIAQAFALMGIKPVWAAGSQRVVDIEVVPAALLGRPRVDVTLRVSGFFRDAFPNVMRLYDTAIQALLKYDDPAELNTVRLHVEQRQQALEAQGLAPKLARRQSSYRVFGSKPGAYGAGLQGLIDERCWETEDDLAEAYLNWGGYAYGNDDISRDGVAARNSFKDRLRQLEVVVQNQDNREHDLLDSDDYYQFQGGMTNAVRVFSGQAPSVYHADHANPSQPTIRTLKEELNRVLRSRVLNPKWIKAMRQHGYKGAFEMAASVDYLFAYDATTQSIADYQYQQVADALIFDDDNQAFLQQNNPAALEEMAERLWEASQRGLWQQPGQYAEQLQDLLLDMDAAKEGSAKQ